MEAYIVVLAGFGAVVLLTAWVPLLLKELPLSLPIIFVAIGLFLFLLPLPGFAPLPLEHPEFTERATELIVLIALMGAGLKLDRPFSWKSWRPTWRLLGPTMLLSIAGIGLLAYFVLGLDLPTSVLLGAVLAPTDPVLASDVQVGPPNSGKPDEEDEVRFALTSEAGLNDGLAFPFVNLAIALGGLVTLSDTHWVRDWVLIDVIWKLAAGVAAGWVCGRALGWLIFRIPNRAKLSRTGDGFVALGVTCLAYGLTEMLHGYGFLAVFVAALSLRNMERGHEYNERMHDFIEQLERLLMMVLLVFFGGAIAGGILSALDWKAVLFTAGAILLVRPLAGWVSLLGMHGSRLEHATMAFYGIRGLGSAYYLAYALNAETFDRPEYLWAVVSLVVLVSILLHGVTVTPVMSHLDRRRKRSAKKAEQATVGDGEVAASARSGVRAEAAAQVS